ncbi:MAG: hypothetical protein HPZ91_14225 [Lentisphaeria bacterium]|nr:hypothetical protein [Lentisphaeria bacterium]
MRKLIFIMLLCPLFGTVHASGGKVVAECRFEGPWYRAGKSDRIQKGWQNNYEWGVKEIAISPAPGVSGSAQLIDIRGMSSGAWQFFYRDIALKRGHYYRIRFKAKAEGLEGKVRVMIRKIGNPWTFYTPAKEFAFTEEWKEYEAGGTASTDVDRDLGILFETGSLGRIWLDDLIVEEFPEPPASMGAAVRTLEHGNLFPRSSFEGERDWMWTGGIYSDPLGEWEDPQIFRAEGGRFGRYCLALPTPETPKSTVFARSFRMPVAAGHRYTFSAWLRASQPDVNVQLQAWGQNNQGMGTQGFRIGTEWKRYTLTTQTLPEDITDLYVGINAFSNSGTIYADGFQLEAGERAAEYSPEYPFELHAVMRADGVNLAVWGEKLNVRLLAAPAVESSLETIRVNARLVAFPDREIWKKTVTLEAGKEFPLDLAPGRNGLFRLELEAENPELAARQELLTALLPPPRPTGEESMFGTHITVRPFFIEYAKRIGMKWNRFHDGSGIPKWYFAEPEPGKYRWADEPVNALKKAGFHLLGLPDNPPKWAQRPAGGTQNVIDLEAFARYSEALARHFRGRIDHWEIWNEPYMNYFFKGTPEQYAEVLRTGAPALKKGNPTARVLGFCTEVTDLGYAEKIPPADRKLIDILSFHCYFQNLTGGGSTSFRQEVDAYRNFLSGQTLEGVWNSEGANQELGKNCFYSFLADDDVNSRAAAFGARVWVEQRKAGIDKLFLYTMHQSDTIMYFGGYKKLIGFDRSVTPAAVATAVCAWAIDGLEPQPCRELKGVVQGCFTGKDRAAYVVFDDSAVPGRKMFDLSGLPAGWLTVDVMGNDPRNDGIERFELGIHPLFVVAPAQDAEQLAEYCRSRIR